MPENASKFAWNKQKEEAAYLLAVDELTDQQITKRLGVADCTIYRWKKSPEFAEKVIELGKEIERQILSTGIALQRNRIRALGRRWRRLQRLVAEQLKSKSPDPKLLKELREHEKQAAQELGQWTEKHDHTSGGEPFKVYVGIDMDKV